MYNKNAEKRYYGLCMEIAIASLLVKTDHLWSGWMLVAVFAVNAIMYINFYFTRKDDHGCS